MFRRNPEVEYLLLHYEGNYWGFVKGQMEPQEGEKETVIRELREETGISNARFHEGFRETISYFYRRSGKTIYKEVIYFLIEAEEIEVQLSYEHVGFEWLNYEEALDRLNFRNVKEVLKKAKNSLN